MDDSTGAAWLRRRAGFGEPTGSRQGVEATLGALLDPDAAGVPVAADPWDDELLVDDPDGGARRAAAIHAIGAWLEGMRTSPRPLVERMTWLWHDHFATAIDGVKVASLMVGQIRTLRAGALGSFPALLRSVLVDPAMLVWLDGSSSVAGAPNENLGREMLELFAVGLGAHGEGDVAAAATALTGWVVDRGTGGSRFVPRRHDDAAQELLGRAGVHDVDSVVEAVCASAACPAFVAGRVVDGLLGPAALADDDLVADLAATFRASGLDLRVLVEAVLRAGLERDDTAVVEAPVPWLLRAERRLGVGLAPRVAITALLSAGQVPMRPPDVGGWPGHEAWLGSSTVLARATMAAALADDAAETLGAGTDPDALAVALDRVEPFAPATAAAIVAAPTPAGALAIALCAPEEVVV